MKKTIICFIIFVILLITSFMIYWNLPFEITNKSEINLGNSIIENIEKYRIVNKKLPTNDDWKTLEKLGFKSEALGTNPSYEKDGNGNYEIIFLKDFDGPYLMWNSKEKKWKIDNASIFAN